VFTGWQNLQTEILAGAQRQTVRLLLDLAAEPRRRLLREPRRRVQHPVLPRDQSLDMGVIGDNLQHLVASEIPPAHPQPGVVVEVGLS
jgi:hypothetical protein